MNRAYRFLAPACALLLAACAGIPQHEPSSPARVASPVAVQPPAAASTTPPAPEPPPVTASPTLPQGLWARIRDRFAMPGCDADPDIVHWAHRFTARPQSFEAYLQSRLPTLAYVEQAAEKAGVPSEFTFLPWVESRYRPVPPRHHRSAGMWQITPATARTMGLAVERDYDGRLDRIAATAAVMRMLASYHRRWQDWRLVDMAYNAGEYRIRHLQPSGPAPASPAIPDLAVSRTTHEHLVKLLAMACVVRDPARFGVHLPDPVPGHHLVEVELPAPTTLAAIAHTSRTPRKRVHTLNAAYLHGRMPGHGPWHALLPSTDAEHLRTAIAAGTLPRQPATYTVADGDSLWNIAHRHGLSVDELRRLNHLRGNTLQPGQVLQIESTN